LRSTVSINRPIFSIIGAARHREASSLNLGELGTTTASMSLSLTSVYVSICPIASRRSGYSFELLLVDNDPFLLSTRNIFPFERVATTSPHPEREWIRILRSCFSCRYSPCQTASSLLLASSFLRHPAFLKLPNNGNLSVATK